MYIVVRKERRRHIHIYMAVHTSLTYVLRRCVRSTTEGSVALTLKIVLFLRRLLLPQPPPQTSLSKNSSKKTSHVVRDHDGGGGIFVFVCCKA